MKIQLDMNALTLGDMEDFESTTGEPLLSAVEAMSKGDASVKVLVALVWICQRTVNPEFTLEDARKVRLADLEVEVAEDTDPTDGSG